eukprot:m.159314 g.159314  ORF g.159314 m.159314 type:complete len:190 (+) comp23732_c1_seq2:137-706(+)
MESAEVVAALPTVAITCFVEWGVVHIYAGWHCLRSAIQDDVGAGMVGLLSGSAKAELDAFTAVPWPKNTDRLLAQHGWNMIVAGFWAVASCYCIAMKWRAAAVIVLVQYFFSWGSFLSIDTSQFGSTVASQQPFICAIGVISTGLTVAQSHTDVTAAERIGIVVLGALLAGATIANKIMNPKEEPQKRD